MHPYPGDPAENDADVRGPRDPTAITSLPLPCHCHASAAAGLVWSSTALALFVGFH